MRLLCALALIPAALFVDARPARACGGLFCSSVQSTPVDQTQERILFEIEDDGSVTATVEIAYVGDPRDFSWIVPIPETPTQLGVAQASTLLLLDQATRPTFIPPTTTCSTQGNGLGGFPLGFACADRAFAAPPVANATDGAGAGGVDVERLDNVGPYGDIVVVDSEDPEALIDWLVDNDYLVTDPMRPVIAQYVAEGQKFLALRLQPDAGTQDIVPVKFTCPPVEGQGPQIPIRLTGIAAVPEMSIVAFIAGPARYAPLNYRSVAIPVDDVRFDPSSGQFNYYALVSARVDEEGGQAFVTERAQGADLVSGLADQVFLGVGDEDQARTELQALLDRREFITRLYTRLNPEEMTEDPVFEQVAGRPVDGQFDMSDRVVDVCAGGTGVHLCGDVYCGAGAECADTESGPGCVCADDQVARRLTIAGKEQITCQARGTDYLGSILTGPASPCANFSCGDDGRCVAVNGAPTCECAVGLAAVLGGGVAGVTCVTPRARFGVEQLLWPDPADAPTGTRFSDDSGGCALQHSRPASSLSALFATLLLVRGVARLLRRRG